MITNWKEDLRLYLKHDGTKSYKIIAKEENIPTSRVQNACEYFNNLKNYKVEIDDIVLMLRDLSKYTRCAKAIVKELITNQGVKTYKEMLNLTESDVYCMYLKRSYEIPLIALLEHKGG